MPRGAGRPHVLAARTSRRMPEASVRVVAASQLVPSAQKSTRQKLSGAQWPCPRLGTPRAKTAFILCRNTMPRPVPTTRPSRGTAAAIAAGALLVPAVMSIGANPSPTNPQIFFWYRTLRQPPWKPPDALIPVAWMALESGLAMGAYRLLRADPSPERSKALAALGYSVVMIGGWSRLFFRQHDLPLCIAAAGTMVASGVAYTAAARQIDRPAAAAGLPFIAWVSFATALTWSIWRRNRS